MRVLHISLIIQMGGAEKVVQRLAQGLCAEGVDAQVLMLHKPTKPVPAFADPLTAAGVLVHRLVIPHTDSLFDRRLLAVIGDVAAQIDAIAPDIVHTHQIFSNFIGTLAVMRAGHPCLVASRHNIADFYRKQQWQVINALLWKRRRAGIAVSQAVRDYVVQVEHVSSKKLHVIYNGVDPVSAAAVADRQRVRAGWGVAQGDVVVGSVSRLVPVKGLADALTAFAAVYAEHANTHYVIVGDGPLRGDLQQLARDLGVSHRVHFVGWQDDPHPMLAGFDIFLAPSLSEGFSVSLVEAMAHALPVVSTRVSSIPEAILDGETGFLGLPGDAHSLIEPLMTLTADAGLRQRFGEAGRQRFVQRFSMAGMIQQHITTYEQVLQR